MASVDSSLSSRTRDYNRETNNSLTKLHSVTSSRNQILKDVKVDLSRRLRKQKIVIGSVMDSLKEIFNESDGKL